MKISIRRGRREDIPFLAAVEKECFSSPWSEKSFEEFFDSELFLCLVAEVDLVPCGYVGMYMVCGEGEITNLAVLPSYRRCGLGISLMDELSAVKGVNRLTLEVRESNIAARALYEKLGFLIDGRRKNFYEKPREDAVLMSKDIINTKEN